MKQLHRWLASPAGVITLALLAVALTAALLGAKAGFMLAGIFLAVALVDYAYGRLDWTFSQEVNAQYHRHRLRFLVWAVLVGLLLGLGLYLHFTGV